MFTPSRLPVMLFALLLINVSCAQQPAPSRPASVPPLTADRLANGEYEIPLVPGKPFKVRLVNGSWSEGQPPRMESVTLDKDSTAFGDLDGDGVEDAATVVRWNGGGSGTYSYLLAVLNHDGLPKQVASESLGDRSEVKSLTISQGEVVARVVPWYPDRTEKTVQLRLPGGTLTAAPTGAKPPAPAPLPTQVPVPKLESQVNWTWYPGDYSSPPSLKYVALFKNPSTTHAVKGVRYTVSVYQPDGKTLAADSGQATGVSADGVGAGAGFIVLNPGWSNLQVRVDAMGTSAVPSDQYGPEPYVEWKDWKHGAWGDVVNPTNKDLYNIKIATVFQSSRTVIGGPPETVFDWWWVDKVPAGGRREVELPLKIARPGRDPNVWVIY